jgi:hypothetical protein
LTVTVSVITLLFHVMITMFSRFLNLVVLEGDVDMDMVAAVVAPVPGPLEDVEGAKDR